MALPKYTEPPVQNETRDEATNRIDSNAEPTTTGKNKSVEKEKTENPNNDSYTIKKGDPQGIKGDAISDESDELVEEDTDYGFDEDDDEPDDSEFYGKGL